MSVYGQPDPQYGSVMAGVFMCSPRQAMLMERVMNDAMKAYAGRPEETLLAKWHNEAVSTRKKAVEKGWTGWEDSYPVEPKGGEV